MQIIYIENKKLSYHKQASHKNDMNAIPSANTYYIYQILDLEIFNIAEMTFNVTQGHWQ